MVGIDNTRKTFPIAYCYITSESAASFKWTEEQLTDLAFYNYPKPAAIVGDLSKGLGAAVAAKATADLASIEPTDECMAPQDDLLEAAAAAVAKLKSLPPRQAEGFAASFKKGTDRLTIAQDKFN
jgi:hypothetical protein